MDPDVWLRFVVFAAAGFMTPGPNTMMVLASGVNFGFRRTLPHILGIVAGTFLVFLAVGLGLNALLLLYPSLKLLIEIAGFFYLLYLAWKIATAASFSDRGDGTGKPLTFLQAMAVQAVNVKLIGIAASVVATYPVVDHLFSNILLVGSTAGFINGPCVSVWAAFGARLKNVLANPSALRLFNLMLAFLIVMTLVPVAAGMLAAFEF